MNFVANICYISYKGLTLKRRTTMKNSTKKLAYVEPSDYFPKEIRKKVGIGEYANKETKKKTVKKATRK